MMRLLASLTDHLKTLLSIQSGLSAFALGILCWKVTRMIGSLSGAREYSLYPWTTPAFHPGSSDLMNYAVTCALMGALGLTVYFVSWESIGRVCSFFGHSQAIVLLLSIIGSVCFLFCLIPVALFLPARAQRLSTAASFAVSFVPWSLLLLSFLKEEMFKRKSVDILLLSLSFLLIIPVLYEQLSFMKGPAYLMNDYPDIYGETIIDGSPLDNRAFLEGLGRSAGLRQLSGSAIEGKGGWLFSLPTAKTAAPEEYGDLLLGLREKSEPGHVDPQEIGSPAPDIRTIKKFYLANFLEATDQNSGRGQINHIAHILNPINEFQLGKPLSQIYVQYGLGNTFLMKWAMDLFGGLSVHNYYKTYIYYTIYFLSVLIMLIYVFRSGFYVLTAFIVMPVYFLFMGYTAYVVAPGIIPTIHLLDAATVMFLVLFLRGQRPLYLFVATILSLTSIVINTQFGMALSIGLLAALFFFSLEKRKGAARIRWLLMLLGFAFAGGLLARVSSVGLLREIFPYFIAGLFSLPANGAVIVCTLIYLVGSYAFLLLLKHDRSYLKYLYICVFVYSQGLLVYYYWSGYDNHLPPVFPFIWFQMCVMVYSARNILWPNRPLLREGLNLLMVTVFVVFCFALIPVSVKRFYGEKREFMRSFEAHRTYDWSFERARVVSTLNPEVIQEAVASIRRYTPGQTKAYILSKYDNLVPFLANRYSATPFFDSLSYLYSKKEYAMIVDKIKGDKPLYLFADTNIDHYSDLWYVFNRYNPAETTSRLGRYTLLKQIFDEVRTDYDKVEQGQLISVYKRKQT